MLHTESPHQIALYSTLSGALPFVVELLQQMGNTPECLQILGGVRSGLHNSGSAGPPGICHEQDPAVEDDPCALLRPLHCRDPGQDVLYVERVLFIPRLAPWLHVSRRAGLLGALLTQICEVACQVSSSTLQLCICHWSTLFATLTQSII